MRISNDDAQPDRAIGDAADVIAQAQALVVAAGAGIGIDSGLPDFRGTTGFWRAYPALGQRGLRFEQIANPRAFAVDPALAWGFYGHRLDLYRRTAPHAGFTLLRQWGERLLHGARVFTSNVDGQFQRAGWPDDAVVECHGSIHHLQCMRPCGGAVWPADDFVPHVDRTTCRLLDAPPVCPHCGALARPNILLFGDVGWLEARTDAQQARFHRWLCGVTRLVVIEVGAGSAIPSVRHFSQRAIVDHDAVLIRINTREPAVPGSQHVSIAAPALAALQAIDRRLSAS